MTEQCQGLTTRGGRCRRVTKNSPYCRYHQEQGLNSPLCQNNQGTRSNQPAPLPPRRITGRVSQFAPITQTALQVSPDIRKLTNEYNILTEVPIYEEEDEGQPVNIGLYEGDEFPDQGDDHFQFLEQVISLPFEEYNQSSYDDLFTLVTILGIKPDYLPPPQGEEEDRDILLVLISEYIEGLLDEDVLTEQGKRNYHHTQLFFQQQEGQEEDNQDQQEENIKEEEEEEEVCCICDDEVLPNNLLACQHPVCSPCLHQLTKEECPMCRGALKGPTVTNDVIQGIQRRQAGERLNEENANLRFAQALQLNPDADIDEFYTRFYVANR